MMPHDGDDFTEDATPAVTTSARSAGDAEPVVTSPARSADDVTPKVMTSAKSAEDATPSVTTSVRSAEDATPTVTSPARSTVNLAIFRGVVVGPPIKLSQNLELAMTSSFAERSSSDVICQTKGGVFLVLILAPTKPVGTGTCTGFWITSIMSADTLTALSSLLSLWRVDRRRAIQDIGCSTGSWASGKQICSSGVLWRS